MKITPDIPWGDKGFGGDATEFSCTDVEVLKTDGDVTVELRDNEFSFRVSQSQYKSSYWMSTFIPAYEALGAELPNGALRRTHFRKVVKEYDGTDSEGNPLKPSVNFIPVAFVEEDKGAAKPVPAARTEPEDLLELMVGKTDQQFKRAVQLDKAVDKETKAEVRASTFQQEMLDAGLVELGEDGKYIAVE